MPSRNASEANSDDLATAGTRPRQSPGFACRECRAKKIRCDRRQPCYVCIDAGVQCRFDAVHPSRGPKRGFLKVLRSRIATLERRLGELPEEDDDDDPAAIPVSPVNDNNNDSNNNDSNNGGTQSAGGNGIVSTNGDINFGGHFDLNENCDWSSTGLLPSNVWEMTEPLYPPPHPFPDADSEMAQTTNVMPTVNPLSGIADFEKLLSTPPVEMVMTGDALSALSRADLDQLHFDRVHTFVPILRQSRFLGRSKQPASPPSYVCLQYAAWTMAASLSSQFHGLSRSLYLATLEKLKALEFAPQTPSIPPDSNADDGQILADDETSHLDQAQAWILIAFYEFMQDAFQRAWASAGRAIRLVQFMRLNALDARDVNSSASTGQKEASSDGITYLEEKRRTFWMAFCLDRFSCVLGGLPLTLSEHLVSTRLPSPEQAFQGGIPFQMPFLSEVMCTNKTHDAASAGLSSASSSPFVECIIFTTLWGRGLAHQQHATVHHVQGNIAPDFREQHLALDDILSNELVRLQQIYLPESIVSSSTLLFTQMAAQAIVLSLCMAAETMPKGAEGYVDFVARYRQRAHAATKEIARLSNCLLQHSLFKVHPFTPIPLDLCRRSILSFRDLDASMEEDLRAITATLRYLKDVNTMCQKGLELNTSSIMDLEPQTSWIREADGRYQGQFSR